MSQMPLPQIDEHSNLPKESPPQSSRRKVLPLAVFLLVFAAVVGLRLFYFSGGMHRLIGAMRMMTTSRAYTSSGFQQISDENSWYISFDKFDGYYECRFTAPEDGFPSMIFYEVLGDVEHLSGTIFIRHDKFTFLESGTTVSMRIPMKKGESFILRIDGDSAGSSAIVFYWGKDLEEHLVSEMHGHKSA